MHRLAVLIFFFCSACSATTYYTCVNESGSERVNFSWNNSRITKNQLAFYFANQAITPTNYQTRLTPAMKGGAYTLVKTDEHITLRYIQDVVKTRLGLPNGDIVADDDAVWHQLYSGEYRRLQLYHGIIPSVNEYVFDLANKQLKLTIDYAFPARTIKQLEKVVGSDGVVTTKSEQIIPATQSDVIFSSRRQSVFNYSDCQQDSAAAGLLNHFLDIISFP